MNVPDLTPSWDTLEVFTGERLVFFSILYFTILLLAMFGRFKNGLTCCYLVLTKQFWLVHGLKWLQAKKSKSPNSNFENLFKKLINKWYIFFTLKCFFLKLKQVTRVKHFLRWFFFVNLGFLNLNIWKLNNLKLLIQNDVLVLITIFRVFPIQNIH